MPHCSACFPPKRGAVCGEIKAAPVAMASSGTATNAANKSQERGEGMRRLVPAAGFASSPTSTANAMPPVPTGLMSNRWARLNSISGRPRRQNFTSTRSAQIAPIQAQARME